MIAEILIAFGVRIFVAYSPINEWLTDRVEVSTPTTSWKRVHVLFIVYVKLYCSNYTVSLFQIEEGLTLNRLGLNPYKGDVVHEPPLTLAAYCLIKPIAQIAFILIDILTAVV